MRAWLLLGVLAPLAGCAALMRGATDRLADNLGRAVVDSDDPATVRDGLPAYLLLLDGMLRGDPDNAGLLLAAAELNGAYAGNFAEQPERAARMSAKALDYARRAVCLESAPLCKALQGDIPGFQALAGRLDADDLDLAYGLAAAWTGYLQNHRDDWEAIADLPKVEALLGRVVELDPGHARGQAFVYLGALNSLRPAAVGGEPEQGRAYFERAIELSAGRNLYAKVMMAEFYARLVFDRPLHDGLLTQVLDSDPVADGFTLANTLAQERARQLLASADDYF